MHETIHPNLQLAEAKTGNQAPDAMGGQGAETQIRRNGIPKRPCGYQRRSCSRAEVGRTREQQRSHQRALGFLIGHVSPTMVLDQCLTDTLRHGALHRDDFREMATDGYVCWFPRAVCKLLVETCRCCWRVAAHPLC